ncbi:MAG: hypothetical protein AAF292_15530 [Pseudomonadota bacterium]
MSQPQGELPSAPEDLVLPTQVFDDRVEIEIGDEVFVLQHHRAETDDQFYVYVPGRRVFVGAYYYQGFLPNLGNGKRVQRFGSDWISALSEMAVLDNSAARSFGVDVYKTRLLAPETTEQEAQTYFDNAAHVRALDLTGAELAPPER